MKTRPPNGTQSTKILPDQQKLVLTMALEPRLPLVQQGWAKRRQRLTCSRLLQSHQRARLLNQILASLPTSKQMVMTQRKTKNERVSMRAKHLRNERRESGERRKRKRKRRRKRAPFPKMRVMIVIEKQCVQERRRRPSSSDCYKALLIFCELCLATVPISKTELLLEVRRRIARCHLSPIQKWPMPKLMEPLSVLFRRARNQYRWCLLPPCLLHKWGLKK